MSQPIIVINDIWAITCDSLQWMVSRNVNGTYQPKSFLTSRAGLVRCVGEVCGDLSPEVKTFLDGLPEHFNTWAKDNPSIARCNRGRKATEHEDDKEEFEADIYVAKAKRRGSHIVIDYHQKTEDGGYEAKSAILDAPASKEDARAVNARLRNEWVAKMSDTGLNVVGVRTLEGLTA